MSLTLLRVRVEDYRGIEACEVEFSESGTTVVHGPNEHGKSSLMQAVDLLLTTKSSSGKSDVKDVKPAGRDVGSLVEVELRCGDHHLTCRKRFNRDRITELEIHAPTAEQLSGDEAHDRLRAVLEANVDEALFGALWFQQGRDLESVDLEDSAAVAAALDTQAGGPGTGSGDDALLERVRKEFERYFTPSGKAGQALKNSEQALRRSKEDLDELQGRLESLEGDIEQLEELERQLSALEESLELLGPELAERTAELEEISGLQAKVERAVAAEQLAEQKRIGTRQALELRTGLVRSIDELTVEITDLEEQLGPDRERLAELVERAEQLKVESARSETSASQAREQRELAQRRVDLLRRREECDRLQRQLESVEKSAHDAAVAREWLGNCRLTEDGFAEIGAAHQQCLVAKKALDAGAPTVEMRAAQSLELTVDGEPVSLGDGDVRSRAVEERTLIELAGVISVEVVAGASLESLHGELAGATKRLEEACDAVGVADVDEASRVSSERKKHESALDVAEKQLANALGDLTGDALADRLRSARVAVEALESDGVDDGDVVEMADAEEALRVAGEVEKESRGHADQLRVRSEEATGLAQELRDSVAAKEADLTARCEERRRRSVDLEGVRGDASDGQLAELDAAAAEQEAKASSEAAEVRAELSDRDPETALLLEANARKRVTDAQEQLQTARERRIKVSERVQVAGGEGLGEQRDAALAEHERLDTDHRRLEARAMAAKALHDTLNTAREEAYRSYREPLRKGICEVGKVVFNQSFDVVLDDELRIIERVLDAKTLPWDSLSSGAKEQLAVLTAVAAARLAGEGGTPLILDDSLGYTDPKRLELLGAVLGAVDDAQIIVLTCVPDRFRLVGGAEMVSLVEARARSAPTAD